MSVEDAVNGLSIEHGDSYVSVLLPIGKRSVSPGSSSWNEVTGPAHKAYKQALIQREWLDRQGKTRLKDFNERESLRRSKKTGENAYLLEAVLKE